MSRVPHISVVVPVLNEEDNVTPLAEGVVRALGNSRPWELLFVDDGSSDATAERVTRMGAEDPRIRVLSLARRYGQSTAMQAGFDHSRGSIIVTMDGDLQNDPADIPKVVEKLEEGYDLVAGYRMDRKDRFVSRKIPSWVANRLIRWITGVPIRDNGCSLKAYRRELFDRMSLYSDMHRFIPALAAGTSGAQIAEVEVSHHPRVHGQSKYGLSRVAKVVADLLTVKMIHSFRLRPLHLFSWAAAALFVLSSLLGTSAVVVRVTAPSWTATALVLPTAALLCATLCAYLLMMGLLAESVVRSRRVQQIGSPLASEQTWLST